MLFRMITAASLAITAFFLFVLDAALWAAVLAFVLSFLVLCGLAYGFLWFVCSRVDLDEPQPDEDDPFYRAVMYLYIEALVTLVMARIHTKGLEKTPKDGRFLLVCNHLFLADPGVLLHVFKKSQLAFITKQENFEMPIINKFMYKILCQSVDRNNDRQALKAILKCISLIKEDKVSIGVFPEGYTSKDGKLHPFRPGVFKIAQKTNVPIVVCTIQNTRQIFKNLRKLKHTDIHLHLVDVIQPEEYKGLSTVALSDMVYEKMIGDLGESFRYHET